MADIDPNPAPSYDQAEQADNRPAPAVRVAELDPFDIDSQAGRGVSW